MDNHQVSDSALAGASVHAGGALLAEVQADRANAIAVKKTEVSDLAATVVSPALSEHTAHEQGKFVALTFDDGPSGLYTPQILSILDKDHIKATFCEIGDNVQRNPQLTREITADGDKLCDHTMTHDEQLPARSDQTIRSEILGGKDAIEKADPGAAIDFYRAPGGAWSKHIREMAASWGMRPLSWSVDTDDWKRPGTGAIVSTVEQQIQPGGVILMHDGGGNRSETVEALPKIIANLEKQGYQFDFPQS